MNKLLNFIYSKKDEGIYRTYRIFGIKIITKPFKLKIQNQLNNRFNQINNFFRLFIGFTIFIIYSILN